MDFIYFLLIILLYVIIGVFMFHCVNLFTHHGRISDDDEEDKILITFVWPLMAILLVIKGTWFLIDRMFNMLFYFPGKISEHFKRKRLLKEMPDISLIEYEAGDLKEWARTVAKEFGSRVGEADKYRIDASGMIGREWYDHIVVSDSVFNNDIYLCHDKLTPLSMADTLCEYDRDSLVDFCNIIADYLKNDKK